MLTQYKEGESHTVTFDKKGIDDGATEDLTIYDLETIL